MNPQIVTVNLIPGLTTPAVVRVSQYDVERPIVFRVLDGNIPASFPSGTSATCKGTKPSGLGFQVLGTIGLGGTVTFSTFLGMTQESGMIPAEIRFTTSEYAGHPATDIGTANFIIAVEKTPHAEGTTDGTQETMQNLETRLQGEIDGLDSRVTALESAEESGLTNQEKNLILTLFSKAAYAEDDAQSAYDTLEGLWRVVYRTITYNLTNCTSSSSVASVENGKPYSASISAQSGYTIQTATVTMGGADVTASVYNNGTISIPQVTGDVVITAVASKELSSITATYTQSGTVYDTDTLDSLKSDLVVTANYSDSTSETVTDYTLSGTLAEGTSTITVSYGGKTTTFNVTVTEGELDTTAQIATEGYITHDVSSTHNTVAIANGGITIAYDMDAPSTVLAPAGVIVQSGILSSTNGTIRVYNGETFVTYVDEVNRWGQAPASSYTEYSQSWDVSEYDHITFSLDTRYLDDSYMYDGITGQVWFAGRNTPFYGMTNVSEAYGELPDGYTKLSYVKSTGEQHVNTGYIPTPSTKFYIDAQTRTAGTSAPGGQDDGSTQRTMFEAINGTNWTGNNILLAPYRTNNSATGYWGWYNTSQTKQLYAGNVDADRHNVTLARDAFMLENTLNWAGTPATPSITYTYPVSLFGFLRDGTYTHMNDDMTLYAFRMYEGKDSSIPTVNLVPCKDPNDVVGLYDTIRREFYHSTTGTELIGGEVI